MNEIAGHFTYDEHTGAELAAAWLRKSEHWPLDRRDAVDALTRDLRAYGFSVIQVGPSPLSIVEVSTQRPHPHDGRGGYLYVEDPHEALRMHSPWTRATMVARFRHASARDVTSALQRILPGRWVFAILPAGDTSSVVLSGRLGELAARWELCRAIDRSAGRQHGER